MKKTYLCSIGGKDTISFSFTNKGVLFQLHIDDFNCDKEMEVPLEDLRTMVKYLFQLTCIDKFNVIPEFIDHLHQKYNKNVKMAWIHNDITFTLLTDNQVVTHVRFNRGALTAMYHDLMNSCPILWDAV